LNRGERFALAIIDFFANSVISYVRFNGAYAGSLILPLTPLENPCSPSLSEIERERLGGG
jgi:hypothetical protein